MVVPNRFAWAVLILGVGLIALVFLGSPVGRCLGPLGVTGIECARAGGYFPTVGLGLPILAGCGAVACLLIVPSLLRSGAALTLAPVGALLGAGIYLAVRPTIWTDSISTGEVITISMPLDGSALATAAIIGAFAMATIAAAAGRRKATTGHAVVER